MSNAANIRPFAFRKGQSGNPAGRKKSRVRELFAELLGFKGGAHGLTKWEFDDMASLTLSLNTEQMAAVERSPLCPVGLRVYLRGIMRDMKEGRVGVAECLANRVFGTATSKAEVAVSGYDPDAGRSKEELAAHLRRFLEEAEASAPRKEAGDGAA